MSRYYKTQGKGIRYTYSKYPASLCSTNCHGGAPCRGVWWHQYAINHTNSDERSRYHSNDEYDYNYGDGNPQACAYRQRGPQLGPGEPDLDGENFTGGVGSE